ncbi:DNA (cytosine-5-)-methyltransferase [Actinosynnema sp. NPDC020468]|uniref:DNA cytosine methyltransferase n=1 Tax=Actinosynnema sp. NPDC020468 TaxID=3154488 RepID=UPI0033F5F3F5
MLSLGSLCSGYGGLDMGVNLALASRTVWFADTAPAAVAVHSHHWPGLPNLGDVTRIDWRTVPRVDILSAGYPCQPFSHIGRKLGSADPRHLWPHIAAGIGVLRPRVIVLENVSAHLHRGFGEVLSDLAELGYDAAWAIVRASDVGAPHIRRRLFVVAADAAHGHQTDLLSVGDPPAFGGRGIGAEPVSESGVGARDLAPRIPELGAGAELVDLGGYTCAVARWARVRGIAAPTPTRPGRQGTHAETPEFLEWMMGLEPGHVTGVPGLSATAMRQLFGNGVVPAQADHAVRLLARTLVETTASPEVIRAH